MSAGHTVYGVTSDNAALYFNVISTTNNFASICKYLIAGHTINCSYISDTEYGSGLISVGTSDFIGVFKGRAPNTEVHFARFTIGTSTSVWAQKFSCTTCTTGHTSFALNSDSSKVYSVFPYNDGGMYALFSAFDAATGAVVGSMYKSSTTCTDAINLFLKGTVLYGAIE